MTPVVALEKLKTTGACDYSLAAGAIVCQLRIQNMPDNEIGVFLDNLKTLVSACRKAKPEIALAAEYIERFRSTR